MAQVTIGQAYEPVEVDLWGTVFHTVPLTRSVSKKSGEFQDRLDEATEHDDIVAAIASLLDVRLKATVGAAKAGTLVQKKWKAEEVSMPELLRLIRDIGEADPPY